MSLAGIWAKSIQADGKGPEETLTQDDDEAELGEEEGRRRSLGVHTQAESGKSHRPWIQRIFFSVPWGAMAGFG